MIFERPRKVNFIMAKSRMKDHMVDAVEQTGKADHLAVFCKESLYFCNL